MNAKVHVQKIRFHADCDVRSVVPDSQYSEVDERDGDRGSQKNPGEVVRKSSFRMTRRWTRVCIEKGNFQFQ